MEVEEPISDLGVQFNEHMGLYGQVHLSGGGGSIDRVDVNWDLGAATINVDVTVANRLVLGIGPGVSFGITREGPVATVIDLKVGAYPFVAQTPAGRLGLLLAADLRLHNLLFDNGDGPLTELMFSVGFEAF